MALTALQIENNTNARQGDRKRAERLFVRMASRRVRNGDIHGAYRICQRVAAWNQT